MDIYTEVEDIFMTFLGEVKKWNLNSTRFTLLISLLFVFSTITACSASSKTPGSSPVVETPVKQNAPTNTPILVSNTPTPALTLPVSAGTPVPMPMEVIVSENAERVREIARWGDGQIYDQVWSQDGKQIAVNTSIGAFIFDAETLAQINFLEDVYIINYTPDGEILIIQDPGGILTLLDSKNNDRFELVDGQTGSRLRWDLTKISPDGSTFVRSTREGKITIWDLPNRKVLHTYDAGENVNAIEFMPDGNSIIMGGVDGNVNIIDIGNLEVKPIIKLQDRIEGFAVSPDNSLLAIGFGEDKVKLLKFDFFQELYTLEFTGDAYGGVKSNREISFTPDGKTILSNSARGARLKLWDVENGLELRSLFDELTQDKFVQDFDFSPDGSKLVTSLSDGTITLWDVSHWTQNKSIKLNSLPVHKLIFSPNGEKLALLSSIDNDGVVVLNVANGTSSLKIPQTWDDMYLGMGFTSNSRTLYIVNFFKITKWDVYQGRKIGEEKPTWIEGDDYLWKPSFSNDGNRLVLTTRNGIKYLIDLNNWQKLEDLSYLPDGFPILSPDGNSIVICSNESATIWNLNSQENIFEIEGNCNPIEITFSPDSRYVTMQVADANFTEQNPGYRIKIIDLSSAKIMNTLEGKGWIYGIAFSPDGKMLAVSSTDRRLSLWDVQSGIETFAINNHLYGFGLSFSPDGKLLVSGTTGGIAQVWGVAP